MAAHAAAARRATLQLSEKGWPVARDLMNAESAAADIAVLRERVNGQTLNGAVARDRLGKALA